MTTNKGKVITTKEYDSYFAEEENITEIVSTQSQRTTPWFGVQGDLDDFIFYDDMDWEREGNSGR